MLKNVIIISQDLYQGRGASAVAKTTARLLYEQGLNFYFISAKLPSPQNAMINDVVYLPLNIIPQNKKINVLIGAGAKILNAGLD